MRAKSFLIALVAMMLPMVVSAETVEIDGICYNVIVKARTAEVVKKTSGRYSGGINIPSSVTYQGVNYSVTSIGESAFSGCSGLTSVTIPNSVTSIGGYAFNNCSGLTSVTIPNSVTSIGDGAFEYCSRLTYVTIPNSVTSIGGYAFQGCSSLISVTIPNSVTSIGGCAFYCSGLISVTIPNSVTSIRNEVFAYCSRLTSVTIPNSVTSIGGYAFYNCSGLTSITIGNSVTSIGQSAFSGCSGLTSVTIPNSVTSINDYAFGGCKNLNVYITDIAAWCNIKFASNSFSSAYHLFLNGEEVKDLVIPNSVTTIRFGTFFRCSGLTSVTIPNSVTSIGGSAFSGCSGLTSVTIPNSVTSIGNYAFDGCSGLTSVSIPNSVTSIGESVFSGCSGLTSVTIPNIVTSIGKHAFSSCSGLTSITIPNSVTSIGERAFSDCSKLSIIKIGKSIKYIYPNAFAKCENLTDVTCLAKSVPTTVSDAFEKSYIEYATLHVPESSIDAYKAVSPWNTFKSIVAAEIPMYTITYMVDGAVYKSVKYEEGDKVTPEAEPTRDGYVFSGWSEIPKTMPAHDVTITGSFTVDNTKYTLTYLVDGEIYKLYQLKAGSTIIPLDEPTKEGYTFSGWSEIPEEMPAYDVKITGTFIKNLLGKCASPTITFVNGKIVFECETEGVEFNYDVQASVSLKGKGNGIPVTSSVTVKVYALKEDYADSDLTTKDISLPSGGDVNGDGVLDAADIVAITNMIMSSK